MKHFIPCTIRCLCLTSTILDTRWHADYAKSFGSKLVQIEAQFGKVEAVFKDFCGFRIAYSERRLALELRSFYPTPTHILPIEGMQLEEWQVITLPRTH